MMNVVVKMIYIDLKAMSTQIVLVHVFSVSLEMMQNFVKNYLFLPPDTHMFALFFFQQNILIARITRLSAVPLERQI